MMPKGATRTPGTRRGPARRGEARREQLDEYRAKRDFHRTPEPAGERAQPRPDEQRARFVVQRHRARRLHYDLRLEVDGALVSWAVPKGPTLDPAARLLAVHVEDHPMEYADFEGVIPQGEYGGGDVIVWDRGVWRPAHGEDPARAISDGELHFDLYGEKLRGRFVLVRRDRRHGDKEQWLLLHKRDDLAVAGWDPEDHPRSVKSGRTNDEVAASPAAMWRSDLPAADAEVALAAAVPATEEELAALDALGDSGRWSIGGRELRLTNLDKILFPGRDGGAPLTKRDLVRYYVTVAPAMLPYLAERALNLHRYPNGVERGGFWHKERPAHAPDWLRCWRNPEADPGETQWYTVADSTAALAWLANFAAIEIHPWTSLVTAMHQPTYALIDIDPGANTSFDDVLVLARLYRAALEHLRVRGFPKVTGRRGIQVFVPIAPGYTFEDTRRWVETLSRAVGATVPELVSWKWEKSRRRGLARLDYTQNALNKTLVAPYSVRPAPGAPVSMPIEWDELDDPDLRSDRWTVTSAWERLSRVGDLFTPMQALRQPLPAL